jgi:hypothetical protein
VIIAIFKICCDKCDRTSQITTIQAILGNAILLQMRSHSSKSPQFKQFWETRYYYKCDRTSQTNTIQAILGNAILLQNAIALSQQLQINAIAIEASERGEVIDGKEVIEKLRQKNPVMRKAEA